ncbi:MAG: tryptophan synthase subunit beta, partial [bacterium]
DYPGVGPEHAFYKQIGRAEYIAVSDRQAVEAFEILSRMEGIIPALESAHAIAYCIELAPKCSKDEIIIVNLSGRGDKDLSEIMEGMRDE